MVAKRKVKAMAKRRKRRTTTRRRRVHARAANPRRRRRHTRRRNPVIVARSTRRHTRRRRRHHGRRRNPSALRIGQIAKDMIYGAGGAILTRTGTSLVIGFVPGALSSSPFVEPIAQAVVASTAVRWAGKKFLGQSQGDIMMLGGLISAGLSFADKFLPNIQGQLTGILRAPVALAPGAAVPVSGAGLGDVYDVNMVDAGFGSPLSDVEDVMLEQFN